MKKNMQNKVTPFLWFDKDMTAVLKYYKKIFKDLKILKREKISDTPSGVVEIASVEFLKIQCTFMTAGPYAKFTEAISFVIDCDGQKEVDYYWNYFTKEGEESQCGWCKDKYGLSWQITPRQLMKLTLSKDKKIRKYATGQMLKMKKIIIKDLVK
jgi:predicted 3-demethylubiquinone-9 3-methyltransferase (glyoxalase superfamily)